MIRKKEIRRFNEFIFNGIAYYSAVFRNLLRLGGGLHIQKTDVGKNKSKTVGFFRRNNDGGGGLVAAYPRL